MKKLIILGAAAVVIGGAVVAPGMVEAYRGDPSVTGPNCTGEQKEAMTQAMENNDYEAWKELMNGKGRVTEVITAENFAQFAEAHRLVQEGKLDEAKQIREELGLGLRNGSGQYRRNGQGNGQGWNR